jgi:alpha-N-arabinofuranosidase
LPSNPILPGFYPDPSICRVGDDFYLVTSSFEYFPGVPVFHSRDLVNWRQIGHCLTEQSQLPLDKCPCSGGIFAPTIRHHAGRFYMITTNVSAKRPDKRRHFFVHAERPAGPWSQPVWLDQCGIDPSLLFDDDGTVYFSSNGPGGIWQSVLDISTGECLSEPRHIWAGAGGRYPEAPHLYKIDGRYYLMIAEGGTEYGHAATIARSQSPWGPWEPCPHNPILSHRDRSNHQVQGTGHADLVQAPDGSWWVVLLGFRTSGGMYHHIGRETFLAPVSWRDGWPVVNPDGPLAGGVEMEVSTPLPPHPWPPRPFRDDFDSPVLGPQWNFLRRPPEGWSLTARRGCLRLTGSALTLEDDDSPAFIGRRQQHLAMRATARLHFEGRQAGDEAGLTVLANSSHHYEIALLAGEGGQDIIIRRRIGDLMAVVARRRHDGGPVVLEISATPESYAFGLVGDDGQSVELAAGRCRYLSSEVAGGFTGAYIGMYATGNGRAASMPADFDWFEYQPR